MLYGYLPLADGGMRQQREAREVSHGVDLRVRGLHVLIDDDGGPILLDR